MYIHERGHAICRTSKMLLTEECEDSSRGLQGSASDGRLVSDTRRAEKVSEGLK
jgi:hypothetical protein